MAKAKAPEALFDYDAYQDELTKLRDKHLSGVKDRITKLEADRDVIDAELDELRKTEGKITGRMITTTARGAGRTRRSPEQLKADAMKVVEFIKAKGKAGASGKELKEHFGPMLPSTKAWVKAYSGVDLETKGERAAMKYFA
jgi:hypothetical protein